MIPAAALRRSAAIGLGFLVATSAGAYEEAAVTDGATIRGVVRLEGRPPPRRTLEVFKHPEVCGKSVPDDSLVVGPGKGVRWAVVTVEGVERGRPIERETVHVLDNVKCRFAPHVVAASVGQWLLLANSDPILHNADAVDLEEHRTLFNVALSPDKRVRQPLARPGKIRITCDVRHTWMSAFVVVADHPYIAATDLEGAYEIRDVPPGRYRLRVWHERLGTLEREVAVEKGDHRVEDFAFGPGS